MIRAILFVAFAGWTSTAGAQITIEQARERPRAAVERALPNAHPSVYYAYAIRLFEEGERQDAVTWFYVGQLRFRYLLAVQPDLPPDGEPALMASLNDVVGLTINEWAGGDPIAWAGSISAALEWDAANVNGVTPKERAPAAQEHVRNGLVGLRDDILARAQEIRDQRRAAGLEVR